MAVPARPSGGATIDSAWGQVAHDAAVAQDIQAGAMNVVTGAGSADTVAAVTFPRPFASVPVVAVTIDNAVSRLFVGKIVSGSLSASGFSALVSSSGAAAAGTVRFFWLAYGPRA